MMLPPPCFIIGMVPSFLQMWCLAFRPKSSILVSADQRILFLMVWEFLGAFWHTPSGLSCFLLRSGFCLVTLPSTWLVECCRDGCASGRFSHLHRGTLDLCQIDHQVLGSPPWPWPFFPDCLVWPGGQLQGESWWFQTSWFKNDGGHCVLGDLQCSRNVLVPFPRSVPRHSLVSEFYRQFLWPHDLVFALTWTVNCGNFI